MIQDPQLNEFRKRRFPVTIFMANGARVKGVIRGFDMYTVILEHQGKQHLVFKHAISTVVGPRASVLPEKKKVGGPGNTRALQVDSG
jgi:host factor-I protein